MKISKSAILLVLFLIPMLAEAKPPQCPLMPSDDEIDAQATEIVVPIKTFTLRTTKNEYITYDLRDRNVNLLALKDTGRGIPFTADSDVIVAEVIFVTYALGQSEASTASGPLCHLKVPHEISVDLSFPYHVTPDEEYLIKISNMASKLLYFWPKGAPCRLSDMKCDLLDKIPGSIISLRDEF